MKTKKFNNLFSESELNILNNSINSLICDFFSDSKDLEGINENCNIDGDLGRLKVSGFDSKINESIRYVLSNTAKIVSNKDLSLSSMTYVEYNSKFGTPNLPPHFDGDSTDLIINFQLSSNTSWDVGVGLNVYSLEDNSAIVFNSNEEIHWRTKKTFKEGEFVKMIFFRFQDLKSPSDYSHLRYSLDHEVYKDVVNFRDSINL
jgi:hypothetical protein